MKYTYERLAKMIDHSLLHPTITDQELEDGCRLAAKYGVASLRLGATSTHRTYVRQTVVSQRLAGEAGQLTGRSSGAGCRRQTRAGAGEDSRRSCPWRDADQCPVREGCCGGGRPGLDLHRSRAGTSPSSGASPGHPDSVRCPQRFALRRALRHDSDASPRSTGKEKGLRAEAYVLETRHALVMR